MNLKWDWMVCVNSENPLNVNSELRITNTISCTCKERSFEMSIDHINLSFFQHHSEHLGLGLIWNHIGSNEVKWMDALNGFFIYGRPEKWNVCFLVMKFRIQWTFKFNFIEMIQLHFFLLSRCCHKIQIETNEFCCPFCFKSMVSKVSNYKHTQWPLGIVII